MRDLTDKPLTLRQREILDLASLGKTNSEIATILGVSESTVRDAIVSCERKFGVDSKLVLIAKYLAPGRFRR